MWFSISLTTDGSSGAGRDGTCASANPRRPSVVKPIDALILEKKLSLSAQTYASRNKFANRHSLRSDS